MSTFGEWLRQKRNERRLTREEFAGRVGCSVAMLRKIESGERRPSVQIAGLIANALEISPAEQSTFVRVARGELGVNRLSPVPSPAHQPGPSPASTNNLPVLATPLIGRQRELAELQRLLSDPSCRLLTLAGPGGIGKTRLAIEAASQVQDKFADGVHFVPLAPVDSARFLVPVIAHSIGFAFLSAVSADPKAQLLSYLKEKPMLLLLDNMEQLLAEPGVEFLPELLQEAPQVKLLVTSRECLNLQAEWAFQVQGLPVPEASQKEMAAQDTSVELFLQRARRAYVGFDPTVEDYPAIVRICRLVDGVPLAIELAAAWVRSLSCTEIADEIGRSMDFLSAPGRDLPARHRSMRAVFEHSWQLLSDEERGALGRLSVFRGGFTRQAAAQVGGASLSVLSALVAKSLVRRLEAGRYDLHELIRQYAALQLQADPAQEAAAREQHYAFYLALAESAAPLLKGPGQLDALQRLEREHDNFRAAIGWALPADSGTSSAWADSALRLACALRWFWQMRGYFYEGSTWLRKALEPCPEGAALDAAPCTGDRRALGRALEGLALLENAVGNHATAYALAEKSAAICRELDEKESLADALMVEGEVLRWQGNAPLSRARLEEALKIYRACGDRWNTARALFRLGQDLSNFGGDLGARVLLEESAAILEELGDHFLYIGVIGSLGVIAVNQGDYPAALSLFERALSLARQMSDPWGMADALTNIGCVLRIQGDYEAAGSTLDEALRVYEQWGRGTWCADARCALAENEMAQGNLAASQLHLQEAAPCVESSGNSWLQVLMGYFDGQLAYYEADLERAAARLEQTVALAHESQFQPDLARSLVSLGRVRRAQGRGSEAMAPVMDALRLYSESDSRLGIAGTLEVYGGVAAVERPERAARAFVAAQAIRSAIGAPLAPVDREGYEADVAAARLQLGADRFAAISAGGRGESYTALVAEILSSSDSAG